MRDRIEIEVSSHVGRITLARPEKQNAFDERMLDELTDAVHALDADRAVRAILIGAAGRSFCAGADLEWMRRGAALEGEAAIADTRRLATLLYVLHRCGKPTVARVQGATLGGGVGLVAVCDVAVAVEAAQFAFTEVRLGLVPAIVGPYVVAAIGERAARRYWLTGEPFSAAEARRLGLVADLAPDEPALDATVELLLERLAGNSPAAMAEAKALLRSLRGRPIEGALVEESARTLARVRASPEGREGVAAFLEGRAPRWEDA